MSPILTRPVREQFEHDRVIRLLEARYRRKFEVAINPGGEQNAPAPTPNGNAPLFPDLVLFSQERGRKLQGTIEVETGESINTLEAMSQWSAFARLKAPFFLYVPTGAIDTVRRLCSDHEIPVAEIWTYHTSLDQVRFTMVHRSQAFAADSRSVKGSVEAEDEEPAAPAGPPPVNAARAEPVEAPAAPTPPAPVASPRARKSIAKPAAAPPPAAAPKSPPKKAAASRPSPPPARSSTRAPASGRAAAAPASRSTRTAPARGAARPAARKTPSRPVKNAKRR